MPVAAFRVSSDRKDRAMRWLPPEVRSLSQDLPGRPWNALTFEQRAYGKMPESGSAEADGA
jgi:hypothetical protein